jgi:DNA replication and repair protein RecF
MNIILLSGGSGKRLWPLSNDIRSKQFIKIFRKPEHEIPMGTEYTGDYESMVQRIYQQIAEGKEEVSLGYVSHCQRGPLLEVIQRDRWKDRAVGYSLHGSHRDDLEMLLGGFPVKREGSQGQHKTFVLALKLAQFDFLKRTASGTTPLLLLDDIFDKLDARRVEQIVRLVSDDGYGQIFITDTNRDHLDQILSNGATDYRLFHVEGGNINV